MRKWRALLGTCIVYDTTYTYDSIHRLTSLSNDTIDGGNLSTFTYDLREDGRREAAIETDATGTTLFAYEYDELGRLIQEAYSRDDTNNAFDLTYMDKYTFDDAGNRLTLERDTTSTGLGTDGEGYLTVNPNAFSSDRDTSSTYDDNDRILRRRIEDDRNDDQLVVYDSAANSSVQTNDKPHLSLTSATRRASPRSLTRSRVTGDSGLGEQDLCTIDGPGGQI